MLLSQQCCSIEQGKKLYELGVWAKSTFHHVLRTEPNEFWHTEVLGTAPESWQTPQDEYAAYNVAELRVALREYAERVTNHSVGSDNSYLTLERGLDNAFFYATRTEAESLANLLIWLLENNLITASEVNQRLQ